VKAGGIRPARRPDGWVAPGPRPRAPAELVPDEHEYLCFLSGDFRIFQRVDGHRWSLDDLVTADYAAGATGGVAPRRILDLGCGVGSVLLMLAWRFPKAQLVGVEAQELSLGLLRRSLWWNGVEDRVTVHHGDLRELGTIIASGIAGPVDGGFDLVSGTPPYFLPGDGVESPHVQRGPCRFEHRGGVEVYLEAMRLALAPDGVGALCASARPEGRTEAAATALGLHIRRRRQVIPRAGKAPLITLYEVSRSPAPLVEDAPLVVRDAQGRFTADYDAIRARMGMPVFPPKAP